ncbi:ras-related protein Rab-37-like isoform X2 [Clavelina lepadiformis]|uniref:ras-related protein Rab-37-like isoform X2 n=1 Tax=Clavelina lepadiformis TaxID=159417 RepID=UPI004041FF86
MTVPVLGKKCTDDSGIRYYIKKVMVIGDSGVGKTCLLVRYKDGTFLDGNFISTVGFDFKNKMVEVDGKRVKLQIWDTAGQERFRSMTHNFFRNASALLLVYDICNAQSFVNVANWIADVKRYASPNVTLVMIGNKSDCSSQRMVKYKDGERLAKEYNIVFLETSAKTGLNVDLAFEAVAQELYNNSLTAADLVGSHKESFDLKNYVDSEKERSNCCG